MSAAMITPPTFDFLRDLKANNNRDWFTEHKPRYQTAHKEFKAFANVLLDEVSHHDEIENLQLFRIYRDVRFSKDKTPYKPHFSGSMVRATKWRRGGYYFHISPGGSFAGGGFWDPNAEDLKRIRTEIDHHAEDMREVLQHPELQQYFNGLEGDQVKTAPRGFSKDHPAIDLLRYKQFLLTHPFTDEEVLAPDFAQQLSRVFQAMRPFFDYMSEVLTTDENGVPIE